MGCDGNHVALQCTKLQELVLDERRRVLEKGVGEERVVHVLSKARR
jgi:hypothetical protein